jgi:hypothetical protein
MEDHFPVFVVLVRCSEFSSRDFRASFMPCCFFAGVRRQTNRTHYFPHSELFSLMFCVKTQIDQ